MRVTDLRYLSSGAPSLAFSAGHLSVQGIDSLLPQGSIPAQPFIDFCERPGAKGVNPPLCLLADIDQPGFPQHPQVPRDARASDWQHRCQFTRGCRTVGQGFQQRPPAFVGHCPQNSLHSRERIKVVT